MKPCSELKDYTSRHSSLKQSFKLCLCYKPVSSLHCRLSHIDLGALTHSCTMALQHHPAQKGRPRLTCMQHGRSVTSQGKPSTDKNSERVLVLTKIGAFFCLEVRRIFLRVVTWQIFWLLSNFFIRM